MATIPLVALDTKTFQPQDEMQKYGQLQQIRNMQQEAQIRAQQAPLQQQVLQQNVQQGQIATQQAQIATQQAQQDQQDRQAFRAAMQDPSMQGQTIGGIADALAKKGAISQAGWVAAKKADIEHQQSLQKLTADQLDNLNKGHAATQQLYNNIQQLPDEQLQQNWPQIAQQYNSIPGNEKAPLNPQQPLNKQQLAQFAPLISMNEAYLSDALARKKAQVDEQTAEAGLAEKQAAANFYTQNGGAPGVPVEAVQQADWLKKNPGMGPSDYAIAMKKLVPAYNFSLQNSAGSGNTPLNKAQQATATAILEGRMTPPSSFALKTPYWQNIMGNVFEQDPQFSEQRAQLRKDFTVGKRSTEINAINTAMAHVGVLGDAIDALNNNDVQALNRLANAVGAQVGSDKMTTFNTIVHRVGPEISKAYIGAGGSAGERGSDEKDFDPALGTQQLKSNVAITTKLLRSKISSLQNQWDQNKSAGMPSFEDRFIMPEAKTQLNKWSPAPNGSGQGGAQPNGNVVRYKIVNGQLVAQ